MNQMFKALRDGLEESRRKTSELEKDLDRRERACVHQWGETQPDHIHEPAYTIAGDPPGTMGIDWRGPTHVPSKTIQQWKRECVVCGKIERTQRTQEVKREPMFQPQW